MDMNSFFLLVADRVTVASKGPEDLPKVWKFILSSSLRGKDSSEESCITILLDKSFTVWYWPA